MLTLTHSAAEAVKALVTESPRLSNSAGLRVHPGRVTESEIALRLTLAEEPAAVDEVIEEEGARVFLDSRIARELEDKVLDSRVEEGRPRFAVRPQKEE